MQRVGGYPDTRTSEPGFGPGYDFVGEVIAVGPQTGSARSFSPGDTVALMCVVGAHATHTILPTTELFPIDPEDDPIKVTALPLNYMTSWGMLRHSGVKLLPGSSVLIGSVSGGLGTALVQLVHAFDLGITMFGTCSPPKFDYVKSLGVTPIDRNDPDLVARVRQLTGGAGVDVAYDAVGSADSILRSLQATKPDTGRVVVVGVMAEIADGGKGLRSGKIDFPKVVAGLPPRTSFFNLMGDYYLKVKDMFWEDFEAILNKVRIGKLNPQICEALPLRDAIKAHQFLATGQNIKGKMVFAVDQALGAQHGVADMPRSN
ncbi:hypothetical protein K4K57_009930 [Colletotrichum sp. SAR 10_99]|nr:hypothetical protein K4K57_009930 [Colletotrichum sp. SAR 10_99]